MDSSKFFKKRIPSDTSSCLNQNSSNAARDTPEKNNPADIEVSFRVDFKEKVLKFTEVDGINDGDDAQLMLYQRSKCSSNCDVQGDCLECKMDVVYQTKATAPEGTVSYQPETEYLLCFRCGSNPIGALLSIIPQNQSVNIEEMAFLSYWYRQWFEREKISNPRGCVSDLHARWMAARNDLTQSETQKSDDKSLSTQTKPTIEYIPNMQIIYQVKKDLMTVTLPKPDQLHRELEIILIAKDPENNSEVSRQSVFLQPGDSQADTELSAQRNVPYALLVKLKNRGDSVELLDFVTEKKILRVQEAKDAPKRMNFLMERRVEQRGTFILHITFDEKLVDVATSPIGEFHLDVDVEKNTMTIGTTQEYKDRKYKVEKIVGNPAENEVLQAQKDLLFEGGVDQNTFSIEVPIPIERLTDYLISVIDPSNDVMLPTTVLAFQKNALYVKEIKSSDVRLHVTVQRQCNASNDRSANANNEDPITMIPIRRADNTGEGPMYCCPFKSGWTKFRIMHKVKQLNGDIPDTTISEIENNEFDLSSNINTKIDIFSANAPNSEDSDLDFHLDVDINKMQARLLPNKNTKSDKLWFVIDEKMQKTGMVKTLPCQLNQTLPIQNWCDYAVKVVDGQNLQLIFTFNIGDKQIINAKPGNPAVRLTRKQLHD